MRKYEIVLMDEEVAYMYSGMEKKLYQLFHEHRHSKGLLKTITGHQIRYITKDYGQTNLDKYIYESFFHCKDYSYSENTHILTGMRDRSFAQLSLAPGKMTLISQGKIDAETSFFEVLRNYQSFFLAINYEKEKYGWLKPIPVMHIMQEG
ncbi:sporulation inhibitor of replication protein SirA [Salipaludibacillus sp. HK11]|uniref:sporulation inhibitor of replication protein SirA n=1 Tax=Salipaludibacillus sp. HK11 TaxID=3394320 RepID=UPI0039FBCDAA